MDVFQKFCQPRAEDHVFSEITWTPITPKKEQNDVYFEKLSHKTTRRKHSGRRYVNFDDFVAEECAAHENTEISADEPKEKTISTQYSEYAKSRIAKLDEFLEKIKPIEEETNLEEADKLPWWSENPRMRVNKSRIFTSKSHKKN